jgi:hypothetical protein
MAVIPDSIETSGGMSWRITDGKIQTGRESDGSLRSRDAVVGYLRRVGIHEGQTDAGDTYAKLEADIETNEGVVSVSTALRNATSGKPTYSSCISFADGLLDCAKDELIQIKAKQGTKPNKYGKLSTYANVWHVVQSPNGFSVRQTKKVEFTGDHPEYGDELLDVLVALIKKHPAYAERPKRESEMGSAPWDAFQSALEAAGWPALGDCKDGYLRLANKAGKTDHTDIGNVARSVWDALAKEVASGVKMPSYIKVSPVVPPASVDTEEYDPFADE